jgi:uroporphyrinogen decarboxylase
MNSKERVLLAVNHQEPDRIPVDFWWSHETRDKLIRHFGVRDQDQLQDRLGSDIRSIYPTYIGPRLKRFEDGSYEDFWGVVRKPTQFGGKEFSGEYDDVVYYPLRDAKTIEDIQKIRWPDPDWFDYDSLIPQCVRYKHYAIMLGRMGVETQTIFIQLWFFRGLDQILLDFVERPDFVKVMIDKIMAFRMDHVKRMIEAVKGNADILQIADDYGMQRGLMMSPTMWKEFFAPCLKTFADIAHNAGMRLFLHCDGSSRPIIPDLIKLGIDILNPIQPQCVGMDPNELKKEFGHQLCFHGAIDTQKTLPFGTREEVISEVRDRIEVMGKGGGYILAPVHTVEADVPVENLLAVYETVMKYGKY